MRLVTLLAVLLAALALPGCAILWPVADVATRPLDKKGTFEETQAAYTRDIRFGLYEQALPRVEPEHRARFRDSMDRFREIRFTDARTESIEIDPLRTRGRALVVYRGYALSSPYEREMRVIQHWRRDLPGYEWYVTPDFDGILGARDVSRDSSPPASLAR